MNDLRTAPPAATSHRANTSSRCRALLALGWTFLAGCSGTTQTPATNPPRAASAPARVTSPLELGLEAFERSDYAEAERHLRRAAESSRNRGAALTGLARTFLTTGRRAEAVALAGEPLGQDAQSYQGALLVIAAEALRRSGRLDEALSFLDRAAATRTQERLLLPCQLEVALLRGEILLEQGKREEAEHVLLPIIETYNASRIADSDGRSLAVVGRAAYLLRSPHDANDAFDEAELADPGDARTLSWRAELYLERHDLAHADEVVTEVLERAPNDPAALVWKAHVRLGQALDFDEAERLARTALGVDETFAPAHFVLASIALRDEELAAAEAHVDRGLASNPKNLELLALRATARFLANDEAGFEKVTEEVLALNPGFTRLFQIVGEYADWEHRYDEIVRLMRRATRIDSDDGRSRAQLGLNLIRAGQDAAGVVELRRAFEADPFNVRVFNTLELYETIIPRDYEQVRSGRFLIRYPKRERALLERYVPDLLERAHQKMAQHYGFEPEAPIGVELYESRDQFAVRTSGLPQTAIQGVCFGRTLATLSLGQESANLGMTLWHELAHVFHIQLSKSRVPRWFTEGVAELETALERPEWRRELDPQLFEALRSQRLPTIAHMSRAFTRAEHMEDVATAYYASNQIATYLADQHGMERLGAMLRGWGSGQAGDTVFTESLGVTASRIDQAFRAHLGGELHRFDDQFVPQRYRGSLQARRHAAEARPEDPDAQLAYALALFDLGRMEDAEKRVRSLHDRHPRHADTRFALARLELAKQDPKAAQRTLDALLAAGHDGYEPRMLLARLSRTHGDDQAARDHLGAAQRFDPRAAEPLLALAELHHRSGDKDAELAVLRSLAPLEEHAGHVHRRLLELLVERALWPEAVQAGEAALWANLSDARIHLLFAQALEATGQQQRALFELESASLCPDRPENRALTLRELSEAYARRGLRDKARSTAREAERILAEPKPSGP